MKKVNNIFIKFLLIFVSASFLLTVPPVFASPYGAGKYDASVPYGGQTSLTISAANVLIAAVPSSGGTLSTSTNTVTVSSTDVTGYKLYVNALGSTSLTSVAGSIPASSNVTGAALSTDTWGYNTDASTNFLGMTTAAALIKTFVGPAAPGTGGDATTVTYGVKLDLTKPAGSYSTTILYTAVPQTT